MAPELHPFQGLLHEETLVEAAGLAPSPFQPQAPRRRPKANWPKNYDSSFLLLFSPAVPKLICSKNRKVVIAAAAQPWASHPAQRADRPGSNRLRAPRS